MLEKWLKTLITDRITIMVVPRASQGIRSYRIPVGVIYGVFSIFLFALFASGHSIMRATELSRQKLEVVKLNKENVLLSGELTRIQGRMDNLQGEIAALTEFEEEIRVVADLEEIDPDMRQVGIGGPVVAGRSNLIDWDRGSAGPAGEFNDTRRDVETLSRQVRLLQESYEDVFERLSDQKEKLSHTPSIMPVENSWVTDRFGYRSDPFTGRRTMHYGLDISARRGEPIVATADGTVRYSGKKGNLGNTVEIDHGNNIATRYSHANRLFVKRGQKVVRGQVIGAVGMSGRATAPHLHYEVRLDNRCVNPMKYIISSEFRRRS